LTLSFWVKSNKTGTYIAWFYNGDAARQIAKAYTVNAADTWEYKALTIDGDTVSGFTNDNGVSIQLEFVLAAGSDYTSGTLATTWQADNNANRYVGNVNLADSTSNYWQITGVQLEVGDTATPFEHPRSYGDELARCQRYFWKTEVIMEMSRRDSAGNRVLPVWFPVQMRATPSVNTVYTNSSSGTIEQTNYISKNSASIRCQDTQTGTYGLNSGKTFDAEL